jgi:aminomethyltransferase
MPKSTVLADIHKALDAKFAPFHGWSMPVNYPGGVLAEHKHIVRYCGISDYSCSGKFRVAGAACAETLDKVLMYRVSALEQGKSCRNYLLSDSGCFIDAVSVLRMADDDFFITTSPEQALKVQQQISEKLSADVIIQDLSEPIAQLDLIGPESLNVLLESEADAGLIPAPGCCGIVEIAGIRCIVNNPSTSAMTCYELFCGADNAIDLWDELTCIEPVRPCGTGARDALRVENNIFTFGAEYTAGTTPLDCSLFVPEYDFTGKAALAALQKNYCFAFVKLETKQSAHSGDRVLLPSGEEIGTVTSACVSPVRECACAICRLTSAAGTAVGDKVILLSGSNRLAGDICSVDSK